MATPKKANKVSLPDGFGDLSSVVDADSKAGRKPSPLQPIFTQAWEATNGQGFDVPRSFSIPNVDGKGNPRLDDEGNERVHGVTSFKLYDWAEAQLGNRKAISVRNKTTESGAEVFAVVPAKAKK